jgi:hypothetical protein
MKENRFYPMTELPSRDESDGSFSKTVIVYGPKLSDFGLGYFDFEINEWLYLGENTFLLKCWCYLPELLGAVKDNDWKAIAPRGFKKHYLQN